MEDHCNQCCNAVSSTVARAINLGGSVRRWVGGYSAEDQAWMAGFVDVHYVGGSHRNGTSIAQPAKQKTKKGVAGAWQSR